MDPWVIVIITLILSAFFSGIEIAYISSNKLKIEVEKNKGNFSAVLLSRFINIPSKFIGALLLGNNIALVVYGIAMAIILEPVLLNILPEGLQQEYFILLCQAIIATLLILIVAEFIPKALFRIKPNAILNIFAIPLSLFFYIFYPIVFLFIGFAEWILRKLFQVKLTQQKYVFSPIDLDEYVREFSPDMESEEEITDEIQMFQNAMEFKNVKLRECMVPRTEIEALEENENIESLKQRFIETGHSKILIFKESIDHVIGYTHSFDLFRQPDSIKEILKSIIIVPETMFANEVLKMMIQQHKSAAVVVDEFGGTSGMVTMEDIMEEIFGEIEDEYDSEDLKEEKLNKNEYIFSARLEIDYLNRKYNFNLPESEEYETLAGFIINHHEDIPDVNEEIIISRFAFIILKASDNRIDQVKLKILTL